MPAWIRKVAVRIVVCALVLAGVEPALASRPRASSTGYGYQNSHLGLELGLVAVGVGAAVGFGIYYGTHANHKLTGCAATTPEGLTLTSDGGQQHWMLSGDVADIRSGDRVRVTGKKQKSSAEPRQFIVEKLARDYGACKAQPGGQ